MKLIIDIPKEAYKQIMEFGFLENTHGKICYKAIKNGTPILDNATVCDIEQIRAEIEAARYGLINDGLDVALRIIDKHIEGR